MEAGAVYPYFLGAGFIRTFWGAEFIRTFWGR